MHNIIYKITNSQTKKSYIGQTISTLEKRWYSHQYDANRIVDNNCFRNAIRKYPIGVWETSVIVCSLDRKYLNNLEELLVEEYNSYSNGYNATKGGDGNKGFKWTDEMKDRHSKAIKGTIQTSEHIAKRMKTLKRHRDEDPNFGRGMLNKKHTVETLEKMSIAQTGVSKSKEHIANMKNRPQDTIYLTCPHCDKVGDYKNMKRWHMERCKHNPNRLTNKDPKKITCYKCGYTTIQSPNFYRNHNNNCKLVP